jgi:hypothetical protein
MMTFPLSSSNTSSFGIAVISLNLIIRRLLAQHHALNLITPHTNHIHCFVQGILQVQVSNFIRAIVVAPGFGGEDSYLLTVMIKHMSGFQVL